MSDTKSGKNKYDTDKTELKLIKCQVGFSLEQLLFILAPTIVRKVASFQLGSIICKPNAR